MVYTCIFGHNYWSGIMQVISLNLRICIGSVSVVNTEYGLAYIPYISLWNSVYSTNRKTIFGMYVYLAWNIVNSLRPELLNTMTGLKSFWCNSETARHTDSASSWWHITSLSCIYIHLYIFYILLVKKVFSDTMKESIPLSNILVNSW